MSLKSLQVIVRTHVFFKIITQKTSWYSRNVIIKIKLQNFRNDSKVPYLSILHVN